MSDYNQSWDYFKFWLYNFTTSLKPDFDGTRVQL